jgi:purine-binding chemotaxis protein CheW
MSEVKTAATTGTQFVSFLLSDEEYAVDIMRVQEIIRISNITRVPQMPEFVEGVINLRGKVIPIIDLKCKFGLERRDQDRKSRIVVVDLDDKTTGLIVDSVSQVLNIEEDHIDPPPAMGTSVNTKYIMGMGKVDDRLLILLDIDKVLDTDEVEELGRVVSGNDFQP